DILLRILGFKEQQLCNDERGHVILDLPGHEDDPLPQETRINIETAFAAIRLLDDDGNERADRIEGGVGHDVLSLVAVADVYIGCLAGDFKMVMAREKGVPH